jgi:hypothetical protein
MTVVNDHKILARQAMVKQWQHVWRTGDTGRFAHSIRPVVSVEPWFAGQVDKWTRGALSAHLEQIKIVRDPICVCMMNYETVNLIILECNRF